MYTDKYWRRKSKKPRSFKIHALFHAAFMGTLLTVCAVNYIAIYSVSASAGALPLFWVVPLYLAAVYLGGWLLLKSKAPLISFLGTSLIGLPLGLVVYAFVGGSLDLFLMQVLLTTALCTLILGGVQIATAALKIPSWLPLLIALGGAIVVIVICAMTLRESSIINWCVTLCINARIGHVWGRARAVTPSVDNAIDGVGILLLESLNPLYYYQGAVKMMGVLAKSRT